MHVEFTNRFNKQLDEAPLSIQISFRESLEVFLDDLNNIILRNHFLHILGKRHFGIWSIDIADDWRALYRKEKDSIIFIELGTHKKLYK